MTIQQNRSKTVPLYAENEVKLGFQSEQLYLPGGLTSTQVQMLKVPNTRRTNGYIEEKIRNHWTKEIEGKSKEMRERGLEVEVSSSNGKPDTIYEITPDGERVLVMHDGDRVRFEGAEFDPVSQQARIYWSEEKYRTQIALRESEFPRSYQAQLVGINGATICNYEGDEAVVIAERDPLRTNQGRIPFFVPAGYLDTIYVGDGLAVEGIDDTAIRKFLSELHLPGTRYSENPFRASERESAEELNGLHIRKEDMRLLSIVYNSFRNHDTTAIVALYSGLDYDDIDLSGRENTRKFPVSLKYQNLADFLFELSQDFDTNSGHLRGGIASLIGHKHGIKAYEQALEDVVIRLDKQKSQ